MSAEKDWQESIGGQLVSRNGAMIASESSIVSQPEALCQRLHAEGHYEDLLSELSGNVNIISYWHARKYLLDIVDYFLWMVYQETKPAFSGVFKGLQTSVTFMKSNAFLGDHFCDAGKLFVSLYVDFLTLCLDVCQDHEVDQVITTTKDFLQHVPSTVEGKASPVNLSVTRWLDSRCPFLSAIYAQSTIFLIKHGANLNDQDCFGDTPLHLVALARRRVKEALQIARALFEKGIHLDQENALALTPLACTAPGQMRMLIRSFYPLPLSCLAAQAVRRNKISCEPIPAILNRFVWNHKFPAYGE